MRYLMRQKLFSFGDDFTIRDDKGNDAFFVDGKVLSIRNKLSFQDMSGNELAFIKQKLLSLSASYEIYRRGDLYATVKKELFTEPEALFVKSTPSLLPKTLMLVASTNTGFTVVVALMAAFVFVKSQSRTNSEPCVVKLALIPLVPWFWKWQSFTKTRWQRV